jgi:hypothetical protein
MKQEIKDVTNDFYLRLSYILIRSTIANCSFPKRVSLVHEEKLMRAVLAISMSGRFFSYDCFFLVPAHCFYLNDLDCTILVNNSLYVYRHTHTHTHTHTQTR